jgi:transcriptional regulator with GAF, ATPase, and Fis domain
VRVGTALSRKRHRDELQRTLLDAAFEVVPASEAAFIRVDAAGARRNAIDTRTRRESVVPEPNGAAVELAISQREAILSNEAGHAPDTAPRADGQHISSVLAVPLLDDDLVAGVLYLGSCDADARFDRQHLELVTAIAAIGSIALKNVVRLESLVAETERLKQQRGITHAMIGTSEPMRRVYHFIEKVSRSDATVLITGETGTGKELAARAIHANSSRAAWPFVAINCAALTETLLEAELFGHERGAFTGAIAAKRGKLEVADRGTVFFDEIGELSPTLQSKLLRALQEREFERVGGTRSVKVDIRIISATNRDLEDAVAQGRFRQDLLFRLNVVNLHMPALRERQQDIAGLAEHFASQAARRSGRRSAVFTPAAIRRLTEYEWPGNVRELENAVERAVVLSSEVEIGVDDLPEAVIDAAGEEHANSSRFYSVVSDAKRRVVRDALEEANGRITDAARLLGLNANYLHRLLRTLKLRD